MHPLAYSLAVHVVVVLLASFILVRAVPLAPPQVIQVRIVGAPTAKAVSKSVEKVEIRTQDSAAPKEPPPEAKDIPESTAKSKFVPEEKKEKTKEPEELVEAKKRPPVLDKTPDKKKVVKNDQAKKVVKDPEDYLAALDFVDQLEDKALPSPKADKTPKDAGEGAEINLNLSEQGEANQIREHIERFWQKPTGMLSNNLLSTYMVTVEPSGNVLGLQLSKSSGNPAFDDSISRAIRRASPLPMPENPEKFLKLILNFQG